MNKKLNAVLITLVSAIVIIAPIKLHADSVVIPGVTYQTQVQSIGWQGLVNDGALSGTVGKSKRLEAIKINLTGTLPVGANIQYEVQGQTYGWNQGWKSNGQEAGTDHQSKRLEAIKIKLLNMPGYSVQYRVQIQTYGWQEWVSDGALSGTVGQSKRLEAIEIKIVPPVVDSIINFNDNYIEQLIRDTINKPTGSLYKSDVANVSNLNSTLTWSNGNISDLSGVENLLKLKTLNLSFNQLSNISALNGLTYLTSINLESNNITDISALKGLPNLQTLNLNSNKITDISILKGLPNLQTLYLDDNYISDISALKGLPNLKQLSITDNYISAADQKELQASLPNCYIFFVP